MARRELSQEDVEYLGLGDVIERGLKKFGVNPCKGCDKRKKKLNRLVPRVKRRKR